MESARAEFGLPIPSGEPPDSLAAGGGPRRCSEASGKDRLVQVERAEEIELARSQLPILGMEQEVIEAVLEQDVVVLSGETGCGKTTQVIRCGFWKLEVQGLLDIWGMVNKNMTDMRLRNGDDVSRRMGCCQSDMGTRNF